MTKKSIIPIIWKLEQRWFYCLIALTTIMFMTRFESLQISTSFSKNTANSINDMLFAISSSFIVAIIIYLFTVSVPFYRSLKSVHFEILEIFRAIKDCYRDLSGELGGGDWTKNEQTTLNAIQYITKTDNHTRDSFTNKLLYSYSAKLDNLYSLLIPYYTYLDFNIREQLTIIKTSKSMQRISKYNDVTELLNHETAEKIINELVSHNEKIINIYNNLHKLYLK